jgi:hypothetical protein
MAREPTMGALRVVCWLTGHRWRYALRTFGRTFRRCERCGAVWAL